MIKIKCSNVTRLFLTVYIEVFHIEFNDSQLKTFREVPILFIILNISISQKRACVLKACVSKARVRKSARVYKSARVSKSARVY